MANLTERMVIYKFESKNFKFSNSCVYSTAVNIKKISELNTFKPT